MSRTEKLSACAAYSTPCLLLTRMNRWFTFCILTTRYAWISAGPLYNHNASMGCPNGNVHMLYLGRALLS
jgi:hypothetical protein